MMFYVKNRFQKQVLRLKMLKSTSTNRRLTQAAYNVFVTLILVAATIVSQTEALGGRYISPSHIHEKFQGFSRRDSSRSVFFSVDLSRLGYIPSGGISRAIITTCGKTQGGISHLGKPRTEKLLLGSRRLIRTRTLIQITLRYQFTLHTVCVLYACCFLTRLRQLCLRWLPQWRYLYPYRYARWVK